VKERDNITDKYCQQIDGLLDNQLSNYPFNSLIQEEMEEIWEGISTELDIGEAWGNISADLDIIMPVDSDSGIIIKSVAAALIILIGLIPVNKIIPYSFFTREDIIIDNTQLEKPYGTIIKNSPLNYNLGQQVKDDKSPALTGSSVKGEYNNKQTHEVTVRAAQTHETITLASNAVLSDFLSVPEKADSKLVVPIEITPIEKSSVPVSLLTGNLDNLNEFSSIGSDNAKIIDNSGVVWSSLPLIDKGRISAGLIASYKNTWLLNHETIDGLKSESLNTTEIVFFPDIGLSLSYSLNKALWLQADGYIFSKTGQEYFDYIYGHYSRKKITLRYSTFVFSAKYKIIGIRQIIHRSSLNLLAGGYLSVLHYASQEINSDHKNIGSQYQKFDIGLRLGSEFEMSLSDQLSLAPGLFLSLGIPNIYKGNIDIPGYLKRTHNGSAGFCLAFYYHFK
jgi:hypothetical protein